MDVAGGEGTPTPGVWAFGVSGRVFPRRSHACARAGECEGVLIGGRLADPRARVGGRVASVTDTTASKPSSLKVLVYSDDIDIRQQVILALGRRPHPDLPELEYVEVATEPVVVQHMDAGGIDLAILDGEAVPAGGMGIAKQLKDEVHQCPPILVLTGRPQDAWLATWSRADAAVSHPLDPIELAETVTALLAARVPATA